jgi:hypothetical protein
MADFFLTAAAVVTAEAVWYATLCWLANRSYAMWDPGSWGSD